MSHRTGLLFMLASGLAASCGGATPVIDDRPPNETVVESAGDLRLIVVERPTQGRVWLSLFVDAGSRDGPRPSVSAVTAFTAAEGSITARTLPDGTEFSRVCLRSELTACLDELAAVLATRSASDERVSAALDRWRAARGPALSEAPRRAEALAVTALLGRAVDPYEGEAASRAEVNRYLGAHYGPRRALLVAIGDVPRAELHRAAQRAFEDKHPPREASAARSAPPGGLRTELTDRGRSEIAVATLRPTLEEAHGLADRWLARSEAFGVNGAHAEVFPSRGGAIALVRGEGEVGPVVQTLVARLSELEQERGSDDAIRLGDDPRTLARWLGARWCTEGLAPGTLERASESGAVGIGVVASAGRGDELDSEDPDRAVREALESSVRERAEAATQAPSLDGALSADRADVRTPDGATFRGVRVDGAAEIAIAVSFEGGAVEEDAALHGVTAMLATLLSQSCDAIAREELGHGLRSFGADVRPIVLPSRWGLSITGPKERWAELTYLAPRCVETLRPSAARLAAARLALSTWSPLRGEIARSLSPHAPGGVAPEGRAASRASIEAPEVRRWFSTHAVARRVTVGVSGDLRIDRALQRVAAGLSRLPEGTAFEAVAWDGDPVPLRGVHRDEGLEVAVGWLAPASGDVAFAARGFAAVARESLERSDGIRARWAHGGAFGGRAFAAVGITVSPDALDTLPAQLRRALESVRWADVTTQIRAQREETLAWQGGTPRSLSISLLAEAETPAEAEIASLLRSMAASEPVVVVARPQPGLR